MTNSEAKQFVDKVFQRIENSKKIDDLENIYDYFEIPIKNRIDVKGYPKINFKITTKEILQLKEKGLLDADLNFSSDLNSKIIDPITKLLYSLVWKNGDLKKIRHINQGIVDVSNKKSKKEDALVFYQFGKYLTKEFWQPIIDQHVIRAFLIYNTNTDNDFDKIRRLEILNKNHLNIISNYKSWLISNNLNADLKKNLDYTYYIDQLLFSVGKTIKLKTQKKY